MLTREQNLLTRLAEECAETSQRATKGILFGLDEVQIGQDLTNAQRLIYEFNDIYAIMLLLQKEGFIGDFIDNDAIERKMEKLKKYNAYSQSLGKVE